MANNSIKVELLRLQSAKEEIQEALIAKGIEDASEHGFDDFAADIYTLASGGSTLENFGRVSYNGFYLKIE